MTETFLRPLPHGISLSCRAAGERGQPVLLFLHGFPEAAFVWDDLLTFFAARGFRCIAPNLRGYENSSAPLDARDYRAKYLVQDLVALIAAESPDQPLACLVAHDWGGAVAWNLANQFPQLMDKLAIVNSPHPGTFLRELQSNPRQQAASEYMNFLSQPDSEAQLAAEDYAQLWPFFNDAAGNAPAWLNESEKSKYRAIWDGPPGAPAGAGLTGPCNYYRASPLRPPRADDPGAAAVTLPDSMLEITLPTLVIWGMEDVALPPGLVDGLDRYIPRLQLEKIPEATHWVVHEQPQRVAGLIAKFLQ